MAREEQQGEQSEQRAANAHASIHVPLPDIPAGTQKHSHQCWQRSAGGDVVCGPIQASRQLKRHTPPFPYHPAQAAATQRHKHQSWQRGTKADVVYISVKPLQAHTPLPFPYRSSRSKLSNPAALTSALAERCRSECGPHPRSDPSAIPALSTERRCRPWSCGVPQGGR